MKKKTLFIITLALVVSSAAVAQKHRKAPVKPKPKAKTEETVEEDPRIALMLEATQQVVFIDSLVVGKDDFMSHIPLSKECGQLTVDDGLGQYVNELGDKRYMAIRDRQTGKTALHSSDLIGGQWASPAALNGIDTKNANFPYVMPDGVTLYFCQKGDKSIGGYDIFVTRYNAESGTFLQPENIGMPFASEANDLFYAIDEENHLGYFVTDRRQPAGKVCIYTFIPSETRQVYPASKYTEEKLRSLARIDRMADTWVKGDAVQQARQRLDAARRNGTAMKENGRDAETGELAMLRSRLAREEDSLAKARHAYSQAADAERSAMSHDMMESERLVESLQLTIRQKEKEQRNIKHNKQTD